MVIQELMAKADVIVNHFFERGATVSNKDYQFVLNKLKEVSKEVSGDE